MDTYWSGPSIPCDQDWLDRRPTRSQGPMRLVRLVDAVYGYAQGSQYGE
jgi:hypothetical protein